jgi:hypothetical protein
MSLSKSKCWYSNNCLNFLKCADPLARCGATDTAVKVHCLYSLGLRLIYTSDFRARFRSKLVPFTEYNYFNI